mmetsp:Transcript_87410/g.231332  ORF Transcript_87410/g.231332 Transcript_87410/m.231332 type:complete len:349 (-) Transcript_87410:708-1754(-)
MRACAHGDTRRAAIALARLELNAALRPRIEPWRFPRPRAAAREPCRPVTGPDGKKCRGVMGRFGPSERPRPRGRHAPEVLRLAAPSRELGLPVAGRRACASSAPRRAPSAAAALRAVLVVVVVVAALGVLHGLLLLHRLLAGAATAVASSTAGDHVVRGEREDVDDGRDHHDGAVRCLRQVVDADQQGERNGGGLVEVARERDVGGRQVLHDAELQDVVHQRGQGGAGAEYECGLAVLPDLTHDPGVVRVADPVPVLHGVLQQEHEGEEDDRGGDGVVDHGVEPVQLHGGLQDPGERQVDAPREQGHHAVYDADHGLRGLASSRLLVGLALGLGGNLGPDAHAHHRSA